MNPYDNMMERLGLAGSGVSLNSQFQYQQQQDAIEYQQGLNVYMQTDEYRRSLRVGIDALTSPKQRVCAYCGTKNQADRCESCGAPAR